jgi:hypothetical protein
MKMALNCWKDFHCSDPSAGGAGNSQWFRAWVLQLGRFSLARPSSRFSLVPFDREGLEKTGRIRARSESPSGPVNQPAFDSSVFWGN